jgi:hypothetical protein
MAPLNSYFRHFLKNTVNLNASRIDKLDDRVGSIETFLKSTSGLGSIAEELVAQGSYAQRTIIKPVGNHEFDADVLLRMTEQPGWEPKDYVGQLYTAFRDSSTYRDMVSRRSRCVVVNYAGDFHVDVVPYLVRNDGHYITNRNTNELENTNPEGFNEWLDERDRIATRRLVEVIRVIKYLRDYKQTFDARSVTLSFLLADRVSEIQKLVHPGCYDNLPRALVRILTDLDDWLQARPSLPTLTDPSCPQRNFHDRWDQARYETFRTKIHDYAGWAQEAYAAEGTDASLAAWQKLFGPAFCKPPVPTFAKALSESSSATDQHIQADLNIPIALSNGYTVKIDGLVRRTEAGGVNGAAFRLAKRGNRVPKHHWIDFSLSSCTVPEPYDIYWKVRNFGEEAERANDLRGTINAGGRAKSEHTSYHGNHYVEVYIVKDIGIGRCCVAIDRQRVRVV